MLLGGFGFGNLKLKRAQVAYLELAKGLRDRIRDQATTMTHIDSREIQQKCNNEPDNTYKAHSLIQIAWAQLKLSLCARQLKAIIVVFLSDRFGCLEARFTAHSCPKHLPPPKDNGFRQSQSTELSISIVFVCANCNLDAGQVSAGASSAAVDLKNKSCASSARHPTRSQPLSNVVKHTREHLGGRNSNARSLIANTIACQA